MVELSLQFLSFGTILFRLVKQVFDTTQILPTQLMIAGGFRSESLAQFGTSKHSFVAFCNLCKSFSELDDKSIGNIVDHTGEVTDHRIDVMIVTHEHQDHCTGIWKKNNPYFEKFTIYETLVCMDARPW